MDLTPHRFTGALNKYIGWKEKQDPASPVRQDGLPFIQGFPFNEQVDLSSFMAVRVYVVRGNGISEKLNF
jgi:hypothetical protein